MKRELKISKRNPLPAGSRWHRGYECAVVAVLITVFVALSGCSAIKGTPEGTWRVNFFTDPDRVWGAIELSLIELDYEVTKENRYDGVIRAKTEPAEDGTVIALAIDQVVNTESQVSVYVKPSFAGDEGSTDPDLLKSAADEFVKELNSALGR